MPSRLLSRCSSMSLICLCLWSTLAFLWCSTTVDAFLIPAKLNQKLPGRLHESFTSRKVILSQSSCPEIKRVKNRNIYSTSMSLRSISPTSTANSRSSTDRSTSLSSSETDSTLDDNDFISDEIQSALDEALGEDFSKELSQKVEAAMQEDYDVQQGVNPSRIKSLPLEANIDMWTYGAKQQMLKGNFSGAERLYQQCIDYNPCDGRAWLGLARIYWKRGQALKAEKAYKDGLYYNPNNPFLLQSWAVMLEKIGKTPEATKLLKKSVKTNPSHAASWVALARIHQRTGQVELARDCYTSAVEGDPYSYVALQAWGVLEADCGNVSGARALFRKAEKQSSKSAHTLQAWATLEKRAGNLEEAERLLGKALKAFPDSTRVRLSYAELFELRGEPTKAREVFQKGESKARSFGDAGFFQSWALFELRQYTGPYSTPSPASLTRPSGVARSRTAGIAVTEANARGAAENEKLVTASEQVHAIARRLFKTAVTVNKYHSASWVAWAKHEQRAGNLDVARRLLITGISNFPHSKNIGWFHAALASLARQDGDYPTARTCYSRAVAATPPQLSLQLLLDFAKMEAYLGDKNQAVKLFETTVKRFPTHDRSWTAYIDFAAYIGSGTNSSAGGENGLKSRNNGAGSSVSWVRELEDRQRVALRSARREKSMIERRNSDSEVDSFFENKSDDEDIDRVRRMSSDSIRDGDSDSDSDRDSNRDSNRERDRERDRDRSGNINQDDNEQTRNAKSAVDKPVSELDFVSKYENEIGSSSRDGGDGDEESEGGAIDRALKLLGLDGRRTSSQGSAR